MPSSFKYRGTDFSLEINGGVSLVGDGAQIIYAPPIVNKYVNPWGGALASARGSRDFDIELQCHVSGTDRVDLFTKRDAIMAGLDHTQGMGLLELDWDVVRGYDAILNQSMSATPRNNNMRFALSFNVPSGRARDIGTAEDVNTGVGADIYIPKTAIDVAPGTAALRPVIKLQPTALSESPKLELDATGEILEYVGDLANGNEVIYDFINQTATFSTAIDGATTNAMPALSDASIFFAVPPGARSKINVTNFTGTIRVIYYGEYL